MERQPGSTIGVTVPPSHTSDWSERVGQSLNATYIMKRGDDVFWERPS